MRLAFNRLNCSLHGVVVQESTCTGTTTFSLEYPLKAGNSVLILNKAPFLHVETEVMELYMLDSK